jgi:uncharacterized RDD family membrane protein YckC
MEARAGFWIRFGARLLDVLVIAVASGVVIGVVSPPRALSCLLVCLIGVFYDASLTGRGGRTLGKMAAGIKVVTMDGGDVPIRTALLRSLSYLASALPLCAGYTRAGLSKDKRGFHDLIVGTKVVYTDPQKAEELGRIYQDGQGLMFGASLFVGAVFTLPVIVITTAVVVPRLAASRRAGDVDGPESFPADKASLERLLMKNEHLKLAQDEPISNGLRKLLYLPLSAQPGSRTMRACGVFTDGGRVYQMIDGIRSEVFGVGLQKCLQEAASAPTAKIRDPQTYCTKAILRAFITGDLADLSDIDSSDKPGAARAMADLDTENETGAATESCAASLRAGGSSVVPFEKYGFVLLCREDSGLMNLNWYTNKSFRAWNPALAASAGSESDKDNLRALRSALSAYRDENHGSYPADLQELVPKRLVAVPPARTPPYHPDSRVVHYFKSLDDNSAADTGGWGYVNNPRDKDFGNLFINCTHTDARGKSWDSY